MGEITIEEAFSADYYVAREKFRDAANAAGAKLETYINPATPPRPGAEPLTTDVATLGDAAAKRVLLVNSGTHGVEAFAGSAIEIGVLADRPTPGDDVRVVMIHAINPHGFAWLRRVTEDNVDLNRNFLDHDQPHPTNEEYDALHQSICPKTWDEAALAECDRVIDDYVAKHGAFPLQAVVTRGQYKHEDGIFFGGIRPTWSNETFRSILETHVRDAKLIAFIDLHTGLGAYGASEMIAGGNRSTPNGKRLHDWYGDALTSPSAGTSSSAPLRGVIASAVRAQAAKHQADVVSATLEFGTYSVREVLFALQADNWLHAHGDPDSDQGRAIKADIRKRLFPDEPEWNGKVLSRGREIVYRALDGLAKD